MFDPNPFWTALTTVQRGFAVGAGSARRFSPDVIPFAAVDPAATRPAAELHDLLAPGEAIYVTGVDAPSAAGLELLGAHPCLQMHLNGEITLAAITATGERETAHPIETLTLANAAEMLDLTYIAFPGFFRARTPTLGSYFGIRDGPTLVAMAGERLHLPDATELSAVCTHPAHVGRGYAARLMMHLLRLHRARGEHSMLHVLADNHRAIALYRRLGFTQSGVITFHKLRRPG